MINFCVIFVDKELDCLFERNEVRGKKIQKIVDRKVKWVILYVVVKNKFIFIL